MKRGKTPLEHVRRSRTLSQKELASLVDVSQQTISKAERGLPPSPDIQTRIATVLGAPRAELFPDQPADRS